MSARTRLSLFGISLFAVFLLGFLGGTAAGPLDDGRDTTEAPHGMEEAGAER